MRLGGRVAVLPAGPRVYVSGQSDPDADLARATRKTLEGLGATLKYLGLDRSRVVRLKAFMQPMTAAASAEVEREVSAFFGGKDVPPLTLVEWRSSPSQPIEIELVAAGRDPGAAPVEYLTPPALKASPVFSRVALVNAGPLIYVSGLYGPSGTTGAAQVEAIFDTLARSSPKPAATSATWPRPPTTSPTTPPAAPSTTCAPVTTTPSAPPPPPRRSSPAWAPKDGPSPST